MTSRVPTVESALARVRAFAKHRGWAPSRLAIESGLAPNTLKALHDEEWNPRVDTLRSIEAIIPADFEPQAEASA